jgi:hypothetical protein
MIVLITFRNQIGRERMRRSLTLALMFGVLFQASAVAGPMIPGALDPDDLGWFYNRPGATYSEMLADRERCASFGATQAGRRPGPADGSRYGMVGDVMFEMASAGMPATYTDDCMISKAYRRFNVSGTNLRAFESRIGALSDLEREQYAGAAMPPEGVLAREWVNSYWLAESDEAPTHVERADFMPRAMSVDEANGLGPWRKLRVFGASDPIAIDANQQALLFMTLRSPSGERVEVGLVRAKFDNGDYDGSEVDGRRGWRVLEIELGSRQASARNAVTTMTAVSPGAYALQYARWSGGNVALFCLGTVVFEVRAGDVVDLGDFIVDAGRAASASSLSSWAALRIEQPPIEDSRRALIPNSDLAASLQATTYLNRFPLACRPFSTNYGFDFPGASNWQPPHAAAEHAPLTPAPSP